MIAEHDLVFKDVRVRNIPTNVREFGGTRYNSNSIFVFELADLCIAHLGHLHHTLTEQHLQELGLIDVLLVPIDGVYTMAQELMVEVIRQISPSIVIPMHYFSRLGVERFHGLACRGDIRRCTAIRRPSCCRASGFPTKKSWFSQAVADRSLAMTTDSADHANSRGRFRPPAAWTIFGAAICLDCTQSVSLSCH